MMQTERGKNMNYSLLKPNFRDKDPRNLPYYFTESLNVVSYARQMNDFTNNLLLEQLEQTARAMNLLVVPHEIINWSRKKKFGALEKRYKIGKKTYFLVDPQELTKTEKKKIEELIEEREITS